MPRGKGSRARALEKRRGPKRPFDEVDQTFDDGEDPDGMEDFDVGPDDDRRGAFRRSKRGGVRQREKDERRAAKMRDFGQRDFGQARMEEPDLGAIEDAADRWQLDDMAVATLRRMAPRRALEIVDLLHEDIRNASAFVMVEAKKFDIHAGARREPEPGFIEDAADKWQLDDSALSTLRRIDPRRAAHILDLLHEDIRNTSAFVMTEAKKLDNDPQAKMRPGDWICECGNLVYAKNQACRMCGRPKPEEGAAPPAEAPQPRMRPGDWICECGNHVFAKNAACRMCGRPKPDDIASEPAEVDGPRGRKGGLERRREPPPAPPAGPGPAPVHPLRPGQWRCNACGFANRPSNDICGGQGPLGCKAPRGGQPFKALQQSSAQGATLGRFCSACGSEYLGDAAFCHKCGARRPAEEPRPVAQTEGRFNARTFALGRARVRELDSAAEGRNRGRRGRGSEARKKERRTMKDRDMDAAPRARDSPAPEDGKGKSRGKRGDARQAAKKDQEQIAWKKGDEAIFDDRMGELSTDPNQYGFVTLVYEDGLSKYVHVKDLTKAEEESLDPPAEEPGAGDPEAAGEDQAEAGHGQESVDV